MKKLFIILFLLVVCSMVASASFFRNTSTPEKALIGHWQSDIGTDYYFSDKKLIRIEPNGDTTSFGYKVLKSNKELRAILIDLYTKRGWDNNQQEWNFANGYLSAQRFTYAKIIQTGDWLTVADERCIYIDRKTKP